MSGLHDLGEALFNAYRQHMHESFYAPNFIIHFSPAGFDKVRADKDAQRYFYNYDLYGKTVFGYPYDIKIQDEDFLITACPKPQSTV